MTVSKGCDPRSDPAFRRPVIDLDQWRERFLPDGARIRYRCIQGGFAGTGVRFSMLFPEKDSCSRRFHQCLTPAAVPGDLPDLIDAVICDPAPIMVENGYALDITEYVERNMPNYVALVHSNDTYFKNCVMMVDGEEHYYQLLNIQDAPESVFQGFQYRRDWIVKYGKNPVTGAAFTGGYTDENDPDAWTDDVVFPSGGMVPTYMVVRALGWVATPWALIVTGCTNAMFMIMMMNSFNSVPHEMYEATTMDGAGHLRTMIQIALPQAMNMGYVLILNSVVAQWNSWLPASIYVPNKKSLWPLQLWIQQITADNANFLNSANPNYSRYLIQFSVIVAATAPIVIAFPFFQDKLEKGVISGGIKG